MSSLILQKKGKSGKVTKKVSNHPLFPIPPLPLPPSALANRRPVQFIINASQPASDKIFDVSAFEKFLNERIKVEGRVGNLGDTIQISQQGDGKIEIIAHNELSGRYLKYLYVRAPPPRSRSSRKSLY